MLLCVLVCVCLRVEEKTSPLRLPPAADICARASPLPTPTPLLPSYTQHKSTLNSNLLALFAEWLCSNYASGGDARAAAIVRGEHVFLVPTMNPDGFAARRRGNARGVDLNRNFPDQYRNARSDLTQPTAATQPETAAMVSGRQCSFMEGVFAGGRAQHTATNRRRPQNNHPPPTPTLARNRNQNHGTE